MLRPALLSLLSLAMLSCTPGQGSDRMDEHSIVYKPRDVAGVRPTTQTPVFTYDITIRDDETGYVLTPTWQVVSLPGEPGHLTGWMIDRRKAGQPAIYFLTRPIELKQWIIPYEGVEIVHAHEDGFFPYRDALYPADFSFERIAAMLDIQNARGPAKHDTYVDNREAYREKSRMWDRARRESKFLPANFEPNPLSPRGNIYFPAARSARYDPATRTAIASDGSRLQSDNKRWSTFVDRDGQLDRIMANWTSADRRQTTKVMMLPYRGYRPGYGETRTVVLTYDKYMSDPELSGKGPVKPPGAALADMINVLEPIAGPHAGHMIVIDNRDGEPAW